MTIHSKSDNNSESPARSIISLVEQSIPRTSRDRRLHWTDRLCELGFGSLQLLALVVELEERFALAGRDLGKLSVNTTLGALVQLCLRSETSYDEPRTIH